MDSISLIEPLAKTIGILWDEAEKAGKTKEALLKFKDELRTIRILVGNCDGTEFLKVVLLNHMAAVMMYIDEHLEKKETEAQSHAQTAELLTKTSKFLKGW